jgi:hypothetical protein
MVSHCCHNASKFALDTSQNITQESHSPLLWILASTDRPRIEEQNLRSRLTDTFGSSKILDSWIEDKVYNSVSQTVVCDGFGSKSIAKIVSHSERVINTHIHVCAKTAFVGWPSRESRRISYLPKFLSFNHYFWKCFKLVYRKMWLW